MFEFLSRGKSEHQRVIEMLSAYVDGELPARARARVDRHLSDCADCRWELETLRQTVGLLGQLPAVPAPRSFTIREMDVSRRAAPPPSRWGYAVLRGATALAALLLAVVVAGDVFLHTAMRTAAPAMAPAQEMVAPTRAPRPMAAPPTPTLAAERELEKVVEETAVGAADAATLGPRSEQTPAPMATPSPVPQGMAAVPSTVTPEASRDEAAAEKGAEGHIAEATAPPMPAAAPPAEEPPEPTPVSEYGQDTETPATEPKAAPAATPLATVPPQPPEETQDRPHAEPPPSPTPAAVAGETAATPTAPVEHQPRGSGTYYRGRPWVAPVRLAEAGLCLLVMVLAAVTVVVGRQRRNT